MNFTDAVFFLHASAQNLCTCTRRMYGGKDHCWDILILALLYFMESNIVGRQALCRYLFL